MKPQKDQKKHSHPLQSLSGPLQFRIRLRRALTHQQGSQLWINALRSKQYARLCPPLLRGKFRFAYEKVKQDVKIVSTRSKAKAGSRENSSPASPQEEVQLQDGGRVGAKKVGSIFLRLSCFQACFIYMARSQECFLGLQFRVNNRNSSTQPQFLLFPSLQGAACVPTNIDLNGALT